MTITATHINYYHVCRRKLWLFSNGINMEHTSDIVYDGKLLHENSYPQRAEKYQETELSFALNEQTELFGKIDFYDAKKKVVHETKRSDKTEAAHEWQSRFYLWLLQLNGIENATAILEYPKLRQTKHLVLTPTDTRYMESVVKEIILIINSETCPPVIHSKICKSCSYFELCYVGEG